MWLSLNKGANTQLNSPEQIVANILAILRISDAIPKQVVCFTPINYHWISLCACVHLLPHPESLFLAYQCFIIAQSALHQQRLLPATVHESLTPVYFFNLFSSKLNVYAISNELMHYSALNTFFGSTPFSSCINSIPILCVIYSYLGWSDAKEIEKWNTPPW